MKKFIKILFLVAYAAATFLTVKFIFDYLYKKFKRKYINIY